MGRGRRGDGTALSTSPWTPSALSLARARGIRKKSGMESKETYFFFRSWEQRGQNLKSDKEEQGKQNVSEACALLSSSGTVRPAPAAALPLTISLEAWSSAPHRRSGTTRWNTGKGRWNTVVKGLSRVEERGATCRLLRGTPSLQPSGDFPQIPRQPSPTTVPFCSPSLWWNHLLLLFPPSCPSELLPQP